MAKAGMSAQLAALAKAKASLEKQKQLMKALPQVWGSAVLLAARS